MKLGLRQVVVAGVLGILSSSCGQNTAETSNPLVTDVSHSAVKRQSIGNCWLYAEATWLESQLLTATGEEVDVSETYWTYWHWYNQIVGSSTDEISTGGSWNVASRIVKKYGWVREGDFIAAEDGVQMSLHQSAALSAINEELKAGGSLDTPAKRTAARVRAELDKAFGASMEAALAKARSPAKTIVEVRPNGTRVTLADVLGGSSDRRWNVAWFPRVYGKDTPISSSIRAQRQALLTRVLKALNDKKPVIISTMIDFNAMDIEDEGSFKKTVLDAAGEPGHQGGHMLVLEDYVVDNAPGFGRLGEGEMGAAAKAAALKGDLVYLKTKNSWGTNRPERGITDGYTRFYVDYLFNQLAWKDDPDSESSDVSHYTTLTDFVLPAGY